MLHTIGFFRFFCSVPPIHSADQGAGDPADRSVSHAVIAFEKITQVIPVTAIPLCPPAPGWEAAHLVEPAGIPRFCDQLHIAEDRIAGQALQKRRLSST